MADAALSSLQAMLRRRCADMGLWRRPRLKRSHNASIIIDHPLLHHEYAERGYSRHPLLDLDEAAVADFLAWVDQGLAHIQRRQAWMEQRGHPPSSDPVPAWAMLVHPLLAYGVATGGETRMLHPTHDLVVGLNWIRREPFEMRIEAQAEGCHASVGAVLPHTTLTSLPGRRFAELVELPPCGNAEIDREIASMRIVSAVPLERATVNDGRGGFIVIPDRVYMRLTPARWRPLEPVPAERGRPWHERFPFYA